MLKLRGQLAVIPRLRLQASFPLRRLTAMPWLTVAWGLLILLWTSAYLRSALSSLVELEPVLGDGPFQLFNPLRRILDGQRGGVDFQFFHGLGVPYLHFPIFWLFGSSLFASELSRHFVTLSLSLLGWLAVFGVATRRVSTTLGLTVAALVLSDQFGLVSLYLPIHSIPGVRSAMPLLVLAILLAGFRPAWEAMLAGTAAGLGIVLGTEHGVAGAVMLGMVWLARLVSGLPGRSLGWLAAAGAMSALSAGGTLLLIGGPAGAAAALDYAFRILPADQFWYFGVPPSPFPASLSGLIADRGLAVRTLGPGLITAAIVIAWMRRDPRLRSLGCVLLGFLAYGMLSTVGYAAAAFDHYLLPMIRALILTWLLLAWKAYALACDAEWRGMLRVGLIGGTLVLLLAGPSLLAPSSILHSKTILVDTNHLVQTLIKDGSHLGPKTSAHMESLTSLIDADRQGRSDPPRIWSCYAGLLEAHYGVFHPSCDYAIHALGPRGRAEYLEAFRRANPDYVTTFHRQGSGYQEWLEMSTWPFYEEVLLNYEPIGRSYAFSLWRRRRGEWRVPDPGQAVVVASSTDSFDVQRSEASENPMLVEVEYEIRNHWQGVPIAGSLPRHLLYPFDCRNTTPISLPPYATRHVFPVYPRPGQTPHFYAATVTPLGGSRITIRSVRVRRLEVEGWSRELTFGMAP